MHALVFRRQSPLALFAGLLLLATACWGNIHSDLFIEPGKQFVLGGEQRGAFKVAARNVGKVAVEINERPAGGTLTRKANLKPGQQATLRFAAGSAAVLVNPTGTKANLDLYITGESGLSMTTEDNGRGNQTLATPAQVAMHELQPIVQQWNGSLTYLDYQTKKTVTLVTTLHGTQANPQELVLNFVYQEPGGAQVKGYDKLQLSADGTRLVWDGTPLEIHRKTRLPNQALELVIEGRGQDDNKNCLIKRTVVLGTRQFSVLKEVQYDAAGGFIVRNKYEFQR